MTPSDAARAAGWQVDAPTADGAPERAISIGWSRPADDIAAVPPGMPPTAADIPLGEWCPP